MAGLGGARSGAVRALRTVVAVLFAASVLVAAVQDTDGATVATVEPQAVTTAAPTTAAPTTSEAPTTTAAPVPEPSTTAAVPAPTSAPASPPVSRAAATPPRSLAIDARPVPATPGTIDAYKGLGTWVDVYDWSRTYGKGNPAVGVADVDRMAEVGVQTLYIQASKWDSPTDILEPELLMPMLERARQRGIAVVAWYLPTLEDTATDLRRLLAVADLPVDSIAVDIEARNVQDVAERNRRLVELSAALRQSLPGRIIGGIVLPPVVLDVVNTNYWPDFPWQGIAPYYDVWMTMGYWSNRKADSGYRDPWRYTRENVERLRAHLQQPNAIVHPIGGLAADTGPGEVDAFLRAAVETSSIGGSLYDWRTTRAETWPNQQGFRRR